jgi:putative flippase GtrA
MTSPERLLELPARHQGTADVEVVVPVHNEEAGLDASIRRLHAYLSERFPLSWIITIADNASTDRTWGVACRLATELDGVRAVHLDEKGRGRALRSTWTTSNAAVVTYMDVDLSTDLDALLPLVAPLLSGHSDVAIGTRLAAGARVTRGPKRELISRIYNLLLRATVHNAFSDAQCGFKAVRSDVARALVPLIEDNGWFFDTELLVLAEHNGLRIHEVPVDWVDDADSRVDVRTTAIEDLRGIWRVVRSLARGGGTLPPGALGTTVGAVPGLTGQLVRFAGIGAVSTVVFAVLYLLLAGPLGPVGADVVALGSCAVANLAANRRITFAARGRPGRRRHYAAGLALAVLPLGLDLVALAGLGLADVRSTVTQLAALTSVNAVATVVRFTLLRRWVFRDQ